MDSRQGEYCQLAEISAAIYEQKNITKCQNLTKVVMLLINIFWLHFITCLSITKLNIIIIISINISISIIIMLVYNICFFHKSKEQSLKITKMSKTIK